MYRWLRILIVIVNIKRKFGPPEMAGHVVKVGFAGIGSEEGGAGGDRLLVSQRARNQ